MVDDTNENSQPKYPEFFLQMVNNPGYHFPFCAPPLVVWAPHFFLVSLTNFVFAPLVLAFFFATYVLNPLHSWGNSRRIVSGVAKSRLFSTCWKPAENPMAAMALYRGEKSRQDRRKICIYYSLQRLFFLLNFQFHSGWARCKTKGTKEKMKKERLETRLKSAMTSHVAGGWFKSSFACGKRFL